MSQQSKPQSKPKCPIPPNRSFQRSNIASFTESRRQRFLLLRKQNRESYFEKARKIALNADKTHDNDDNDAFDVSKMDNFDFSWNNIEFHDDFESEQVSTNKYAQYPPQRNMNNNNNNNNNKEQKADNNDNDDNNNNDTNEIQTDHGQKKNDSQSPSNDKKSRKKKKNKKNKKKNKWNKENQEYRKQQLMMARKSRMKYVNMFMVHEWMIDIPHDLTQNWLVGLRAEGERCLVFSNGGRTISRNKTGNFIHSRFPSSLPAGNIVQQKKSCVTILDCIWIASINTYYVIDCILWSDQQIGLNDAQMRLWFIRSKLNECWNIDTITKYNKYRFISIETMDISIETLNYLYNGGNLLNNDSPKEENGNNEEKKEDDAQKRNYGVIGVDAKLKKKWYRIEPDGLIFYHKHGCYVESVSCPLILIWKDSKISRWFIDTANRQNKNKLLQFISLHLRNNGAITTHENDIVLSIMSPQKIQKYKFKPNELLRFSITNAIMNECKVDNLLYLKRCSMSKMQADTWSKIVFQHQAKHEQSVQFQDIINIINNDNKKNKKLEINDNDWNKQSDDIERELRTATLGLTNFHL